MSGCVCLVSSASVIYLSNNDCYSTIVIVVSSPSRRCFHYLPPAVGRATMTTERSTHTCTKPLTNQSNPNPTTKQHAAVSIQLNIVTCPTYPGKFIHYIFLAPFLLLTVVIVTPPVYCNNAGSTGPGINSQPLQISSAARSESFFHQAVSFLMPAQPAR